VLSGTRAADFTYVKMSKPLNRRTDYLHGSLPLFHHARRLRCVIDYWLVDIRPSPFSAITARIGGGRSQRSSSEGLHRRHSKWYNARCIGGCKC
jgi:hypothetical protein